MFGDVLGYEILLLVTGGWKRDDELCVIRGEGDGRSWQQTERQ